MDTPLTIVLIAIIIAALIWLAHERAQEAIDHAQATRDPANTPGHLAYTQYPDAQDVMAHAVLELCAPTDVRDTSRP